MTCKPVHRRDVLALAGGAAAWPLTVHAQQRDRVRWIGVLVVSVDDAVGHELSVAFERTLEGLGWTVGRNLAIDYRWGINDAQKARLGVAQILRLKPDVILANAGSALTAAQEATRTVPIVFTGISEPVERGFVVSLARPGGNTTGFTNLETTVGGKWLELFNEIAPQMTRVTAMFNPASTFSALFVRSAQTAAQKRGVEVRAAHVRDPTEIEAAMSAIGREPHGGLMLPPDGFTGAHHQQIIALTERYHLPSITQFRTFPAEGGLMSYGADLDDTYRKAAIYVDRILRGEKPADLPVQQPTKFDLVINMKTAKALGLTVPLTLQVAADEVIE